MPTAYLIVLFSVLFSMVCAQPVTAAIYRCERDGEPVLYSQFICPPQDQQEHYQPQPHNLVSIPPLSGAETAALAKLKKNLQRTRLAASKAKARARSQLAQQAIRAEQLCTQAKHQLAALRDRKRQGYSTADGRELDAETERLQIQKKANC